MAKQAADLYTLDLLEKPKRGRPKKPDALTPAQRAKAYRERLKADPLRRFNLLLNTLDAIKPAAMAQLDAQRAAKRTTEVVSSEEWPFPREARDR